MSPEQELGPLQAVDHLPARHAPRPASPASAGRPPPPPRDIRAAPQPAASNFNHFHENRSSPVQLAQHDIRPATPIRKFTSRPQVDCPRLSESPEPDLIEAPGGTSSCRISAAPRGRHNPPRSGRSAHCSPPLRLKLVADLAQARARAPPSRKTASVSGPGPRELLPPPGPEHPPQRQNNEKRRTRQRVRGERAPHQPTFPAPARPWVPPNPKEFDSATSILRLRATFGARSELRLDRRRVELIVGGAIWSRIASTQKIAIHRAPPLPEDARCSTWSSSSSPAPPRCPEAAPRAPSSIVSAWCRAMRVDVVDVRTAANQPRFSAIAMLR